MKKAKPNETGVVFVRRLPKHIPPQFKAACASRGKTMKYIMQELMKGYISGRYRVK